MGHLRFGVQGVTKEGRRVSGTYKIFTGARDDDVYILRREAGSSLKVSLHASGLSKMEYDGRGGGHDRPSRVEWTLREPDDEGKVPAAIVYISSALVSRTPPTTDASVVWSTIPRSAAIIEFQVWITRAPSTLTLDDVELVGVLPLPSGSRQVVVISMPRSEPPDLALELAFDGDVPGWVDRAVTSSPNLMIWTIKNQICRIIDGAEVHADTPLGGAPDTPCPD